MKDQEINGAGLAGRIGELTGAVPSPVWVSRRTGSGSRPVRLLGVDPDLFLIARALEINRSDLIELVIRAVFGDSIDEPIPYELTGQPLPVEPAPRGWLIEHTDHHTPGDPVVGCTFCPDVEVPLTPTEAEYGDLPVLDPSILPRASAGDL